MTIRLKFWGVRGSIACPSPNHVVYGGNTSCVQIESAGGQIILDAGTGFRGLGQELLAQGTKSAILLLTHTHWDHINGFPFFAPAYRPDWSMRVMAGHLDQVDGIESILASQMNRPMFPIPLDALKGQMTYEDFRAGESLKGLVPGVLVKTAALNHPNRATGYRVETEGVSVAYITDTEHVPGEPDESVLSLMEGADLVIYDSTYTDEEFASKRGWGHSTWEEGIRLARQSRVKTLVIFHHDPDHDDAFMERVEDESRRVWSGAVVARDNMVISLG